MQVIQRLDNNKNKHKCLLLKYGICLAESALITKHQEKVRNRVVVNAALSEAVLAESKIRKMI